MTDKLKDQSGAALLTVLVAMMIITIMLFEFQYSSMVERKLAYNELNQLQAYYLAKSGARIGLLRVSLYGRIRRSQDFKNMTKSVPGADGYLDMVWQLPLPPFPPESSGVKKLDKADKDAAEKTLQQTKVTEGFSSHVITNESGKINLNYLQIPKNSKIDRVSFTGTPQGPFHYTGLSLINILDGFLQQSENPNEEYEGLRPEEMVLDIMDWVNIGPQRLSGGNKDAFYEQQKPPYRAKRGRFYTLDELKLVKGMNDHLYTKLKPFVTVYGYEGKININSASSAVIKALHRDLSDDDVKKIQEEKDRLGNWSSTKQFVDYIGDTLGRGSFKTTYGTDDTQYPFSVGSQSFLIESMGTIRKSNSQIQKVLRVAAVLTQGRGGTGVDASITNPAQCAATAGRAWDPRFNNCKFKPTSRDSCESNWAGSWKPSPDNAAVNCCYFANNNPPPLCPDTSAAGKSSTAAEANALKVLYWSEN